MFAFVSPLLTDIKHNMTAYPYASVLHSRWTGKVTLELFRTARPTLPALWKHPLSGENDTLP